MSTNTAKVIEKQGAKTPNGREVRLQLRRGENGTGEIIQEVVAWPWSPKSMEQADEIMRQAADRAGVKLTPYEPED